MKFSDRIGETIPIATLQIKSIDESLKNTLWNVYDIAFLTNVRSKRYWSDVYGFPQQYIRSLWHHFFKKRIDEIPFNTGDLIQYVSSWFFYRAKWYDIYNLLEFSYDQISDFQSKEDFSEACNAMLARESSAYRFINGSISPITSEIEIKSLADGITTTSTGRLKAVNIHLKSALGSLSNKENPDYRNTIKEAISAVESLCRIIASDDKATLGAALKVIKSKIEIHPAFELALQKLYAYTNDEGGLRHSLVDEVNVADEDAIFMLITCSAFINYLIVKADKTNLLPKN
ncbi:MAG: hypothetical protein HY064_16825 [Bacteroidetes bacterium]|nr:hypothetical protein [Bacteroidota bacterium]